MRVAADARRSYYRAVASQQLATLLVDAQFAAANAAKLATRLGESGALNKLNQAREQVFYAEITAQLAGVRQKAANERERVFRPFYRVLGTDVDGSGLGLAIVREIAQQHRVEVVLVDANLRYRRGLNEQAGAAFGPGARFTLRFFLAPQSLAHLPPRGATHWPGRAGSSDVA